MASRLKSSIRPIGGLAHLGRVENSSVHQKVYGQLRQAIMSGKFEPGETLTLRALAAALGTSIIPARDAVLRLVTERALEDSARSVRIPRLSLAELQDLERMRIALEGEAAALAAERRTSADLSAIKSAAAKVERARLENRIDRFLTTNQEFHFAVYSAAHSDLLKSLIETLWLQIGPHLSRAVHNMQGIKLTDSVNMAPHNDLIVALETQKPDAARAALAADLVDSADVYWHHPENEESTETIVVKPKRARAG